MVSDKAKRQIIVYGSSDALAALAAARDCGATITLVSPAGAAAFGGPAWFREVVAQARAGVPGAVFDAVLDCADATGHALAAMRDGADAIAFSGPADVTAKIRDIAAQSACAVVEIDYQRALDLRDCADAAAACRAWLAARPSENDA